MGATDGDLLLRAILENPAEDTPRLVYADWLQENGQGERAEFIRVQCILASGYTNAKVVRRERALLLNESPGWVPGWEVITSRRWKYRTGIAAELRRGFVAAITCTAADWLAHGDAIVAAHPVEFVRLTTWPSVAQLAAHPRARAEDVGAHPDAFLPPEVLTKLFGRLWPRVRVELPPEPAFAPGAEPVAWEVPVRAQPAPDPGALLLAGLGWRIEVRQEPTAEYGPPVVSAELHADTAAPVPSNLLGTAFGPVRATDTFGRVWHVERAFVTWHDTTASREGRVTTRVGARSAGPVRPARADGLDPESGEALDDMLDSPSSD